MAKFGNGYGSECHLLRYLGRHQEALRSAVCGAVASASDVRWLDFPFAASWPGDDPKSHWPDAEWKSLAFLQEENPGVVRAWKECWPHGSGVMNWDAVGQIKVNGTWEWLLVEAKSHTGEIESDSGAGDKSKRKIESVFKDVKYTLNVPQTADWLTKYYQYANRLAVLHHLDTHSVKRLLFIYFCVMFGVSPQSKDCPRYGTRHYLWQSSSTVPKESINCSFPSKHVTKILKPP